MPKDTLDDVLAIAREVIAEYHDPMGGHLPTRIERLAQWLADNLGEAQPCGWDEAKAVTWHGDQFVSYQGDLYSPGEARAACAVILRACEEAER